MLAVFTYGFEVAIKNFKKKNIALHTLSDYENLINLASQTNYIKEEQLSTLMEWRANPSKWQSE
jgi:orotate phosphoribosyltransferase